MSRKHGKHWESIRNHAKDTIEIAMWSARVHREARLGAVIVAGPSGEVMRVNSINLNKYGVDVSDTSFQFLPKVLKKIGVCWTEKEIRALPVQQTIQRRTS